MGGEQLENTRCGLLFQEGSMRREERRFGQNLEDDMGRSWFWI